MKSRGQLLITLWTWLIKIQEVALLSHTCTCTLCISC